LDHPQDPFRSSVDAIIGAFSSLATTAAADRSVVVALTEANSRLAKQLEYRSTELKAIRELLKKERTRHRYFTPFAENYCWSNGYKVVNSHTSQSCNLPKQGHKHEANNSNNMGGSQAKK
jgi:hypothetical protein